MNAPLWPRSRVLGFCRQILARAGRRIPSHRRQDWLAEWEGELWALHRDGARPLDLLRFALGAFSVARWEASHDGLLTGLRQDVRQAARRLRGSPGFAVVVVAVLALGIGANTALLGALRAILAGSRYPDADRLVVMDLLSFEEPGVTGETMPWSYPKFELLREQLRSVATLSGYATNTATLTGEQGPARIGVEFVSPAYFDLLGIQAQVGRMFHASEDPPDSSPYVILSHSLWVSRYGGDPGIIGRTLHLDGGALEVVGVLPEGFHGLTGAADVWVPMAGILAAGGEPWQLNGPFAHWFYVFGRLAPGTTIEQASARVAVLGATLAEKFPDRRGGGAQSVVVVPFLRAKTNAITRLAVTAVTIGGMLFLLIACANVAGLLLTRASARQTDTAVRAALGAGRARLVRESLVESMLLASIGGGLGLLLAHAGERAVARAVTEALQTSGTRGLQFVDPQTIAVDAKVLACGVGLALLTGLVFGALPAWAASRADLTRDLRSGDRSFGTPARAWQGVLVAGQLALTLVLLAGAGLMGASFARLSSIDVGFTNDRVLALRYEQRPGSLPDHDRLFEQSAIERLSGLQGVLSVAMGPCPPLTGVCDVAGIRRIDDRAELDPSVAQGGILTYAVSDEYFSTLGITIHQGRTFRATDAQAGPPLAVLNETAARKLFPGIAPVGHRISVTRAITQFSMAEIVGVVADVRYGRVDEPAMASIYFSRRQAPSSYGTLYVHTSGDPLAMVSAVRHEIAALEPDLPLFDITTMADLRALATARTRIVLGLLAAFASTGLVLSVVGLYGTVSYAIVRRMRELGLRVALGAARPDVLRLVMTPPVRLVLGGAVSGLAGTILLTRLMEGLLYGVEPTDPRVLVSATGFILAVAVVSAWIPALRATRVDPATSLRGE